MAVFFAAMLLMAGTAIYAVDRFRAEERAVADYCRRALVGESVADAGRKAEKQGLLVTSRRVSDVGEASLSVGSHGSWFSAISFCTLFHDGARITRVSLNPWYH